jgi:hypothetical protein
MLKKNTRTSLLAALMVGAAFAASALAEPLSIEMVGNNAALFKGHANFAVPTYHVNFVTSHQATAVASISARARLAMVLVGPDETIMRRLTDEAYADLRAQFTAAGLPLLSEADTKTVAAEMELVPGNMDKAPPISGFTIGKSNRRGWVTFGPGAAPAMTAFRNMSSPNGMTTGFAGLAASKMNKPAGVLDAIVIVPSLTVDFANLTASTGSNFLGRSTASVGGTVGFSVLAGSPVTFQNPAGQTGMGTPGTIRPKEDVLSKTVFAKVEEGGAAVNVGSMASVVDENYQTVQRARGDAVVVDIAVWEGRVRDAYKAYNGRK